MIKDRRGVRRDNKMKGSAGNDNRRNTTKFLVPQHNDAPKIDIGQQGSPIPMSNNFRTKTINSFKISSCLNQANNYKEDYQIQSTSGRFGYLNPPAISTQDFRTNHNHYKE